MASTMPYRNDPKTRVSVLTFSRPASRNAALPSTMLEWLDGIRRAAGDPDCSVLVLTGQDAANGRNFYCSGIETEALKVPLEKITDADLEAGLAVWRELVRSMIAFPKILVAAVNGNAIGFGFTTLGLADFVYAREDAGLLAPFTRVGVPPGGCSTAIFPRLFGERRAFDILVGANRITAKEAAGSFVTRIFPASTPSILDAAMAKDIVPLAQLSPAALFATKAMLRPQPWRDEMLALNDRECKALGDILLGIDGGGKKPVSERPVNFVRYFGELGVVAKQQQFKL
ncbi:ClpP/crotonase-like domain-containing protein [Hyaloraphidium curvatum]|nr:ClpP/crotonase-like domain-containing protein [Hyaloraphidium curvatum]